jgi:hypothetical protein
VGTEASSIAVVAAMTVAVLMEVVVTAMLKKLVAHG